MIKSFSDGHRRQWKTYCSSCGAYLGSTAPMESRVPREVLISNVCPRCGGQIHKEADEKPKKEH